MTRSAAAAAGPAVAGCHDADEQSPEGTRASHPSGQKEIRLLVRNVSPDATENSVRQLFAQYGRVTGSSFPVDRETGRRLDFVGVGMPAREAEVACSELNGIKFEGRILEVHMAKLEPDFAGEEPRFSIDVSARVGSKGTLDSITAPQKLTASQLGRPDHKGERVGGHKLRSERSRQRQLQKNILAKKCERCGQDDIRYKLRACSGCKLALYCSVACQRAARGSHRRICEITSELPPSDANRLLLRYDKDHMNDLDAGLRYATKYMDSLKHLEIRLAKMGEDDKVKLSTKKLSSLLKSKKGALDSVFLSFDNRIDPRVLAIVENSYEVWKELRGLTQLRLQYMLFDDVQHICDIIHQQSEELVLLSLPALASDWKRESCRKAFASAVNSCKKMVTLDLQMNALQDSELEVMLNDLPNLRILNLRRNVNITSLRGLTDKSCAIFARKCPFIQELNVRSHDKLSVKGIRKIFKGCTRLRSFHTTTNNLSCKDILGLLNIAPQLMFFSLNRDFDLSRGKLDKIIEATGGRTLLGFAMVVYIPNLTPESILSTDTREKYQQQRAVYRKILSRGDGPEVANIWGDIESKS